eukprot:m.152875 g.152875  ORF g.152875 m.152875 type:complete len:105 (+) comp16222_c0_seq10:795-1109(+)
MASIANPLAEALYGFEYGTLNNHKCFTVEYGADADRELTLHYDNSLVTMNVCISEDFEGGELQFWEQRPGWVLFHRGSAWHRAPIIMFRVLGCVAMLVLFFLLF